MGNESTTATFKVDETLYHDLQLLKERTGIPIRVIVDLLGELAASALQTRVRGEWEEPQERFLPNQGQKIVHMSNHVHKRLSSLTKKIGLNVTTAVNEAFYSKRSDINKLKGLRLEKMNQCWNATCETAELASRRRIIQAKQQAPLVQAQ
ncbi:MAG: hypothetical protein CMM54_00610 [Rhodospirillaceae bacterium]|nr:hypothetical protein [Rhodospirillaceae bacterium]